MTSIRTPHRHPIGVTARWSGVDDLAARFAGSGSTLLAVWAHPDDESVLAGGLLAAFAAAGGRVVNVTATLGEHGTPDPAAEPPAILATRRRVELGRALKNLGVRQSIVLGLEDGTCADQPVADGVDRMARVVDAIRPDVVVSFGPDGVTGHPDHRAVAEWTAGAVAAVDCGAALWTTRAAVAWPDDVVAGLHRIDAFYGDGPERKVVGPCNHVEVHGSALRRKVAAISAHASQMGPLRAELGERGIRRLASFEAYQPSNRAALDFSIAAAAPVAA